MPTTGNNEVIKATPGANGIAVFDITSAQLAAIPSFTINLNGASTVVFNVSGSSDTFSANDESGTNGAGNIIWNFYNATTVNLTTAIGGTVLATGATVSNANQIDGALVANSLTGSGELHDIPFCRHPANLVHDGDRVGYQGSPDPRQQQQRLGRMAPARRAA